MADGFSEMIATARDFLRGLEQNNDRGWFEAHKGGFKTGIEAPLRLLTELFASDLGRLTGVPHAGKVGRIYRDVRFSKDKSPYNTHVHASWVQPGAAGPGWLLHIGARGATLMTGLHALDPGGLARYRAAVDRDGDALQAAIDAGVAAGAGLIDLGDSTLVRVPKPYAADHRHGALLRCKAIALGGDLPDAAPDGLIAAMAARGQAVLPFWRWCQAAMG